MRNSRRNTHGGALLAVLWLSAALSAIAFSVATTVRGETERTATLADGVRTYYLATGAIERARLYIDWGAGQRNPDGSAKYYESGMPRLAMQFPSGTAVVEIIPETAKLNINNARPQELMLLLAGLGAPPERAGEISLAIADWRAAPPGGLSLFDQYYLSLTPSFRARHASFQEIEELLLVKGMTPDLFYGTFVRDSQGRLLPQAGLKDCVSVYGSSGAVNANYAPPAVLTAVGLSPATVEAIVQRRRALPFRSPEELAPFIQAAGPAGARLSLGGSTILTLRATARLRLPNGQYSDLSRSVSALLKFNSKPVDRPPVEILRWYDN
jgi:general secretion pathway protein K